MDKQVEEGTLLDDRWQRAAAAVVDRDDQVCAAMIYKPDTSYPELPQCPSCGVQPEFFESPNALDYSVTNVTVECDGCNYSTRPASFDTMWPEDAENATPEAYAKHCKDRVDAIGLAAKRWEIRCMGAEAALSMGVYRTELKRKAEECLSSLVTAQGDGMPTRSEIGPLGPGPVKRPPPKPLDPEVTKDHRPSSGDLKTQINALLWAVLPPSATLGEADDMACEIHNKIMKLWDREKP